MKSTYGKIVEVLVNTFFDKIDDIKSYLKNRELIEDKGGGDLTYRFDLDIEELIYRSLREEIGDIRVLGEERSYGSSVDESFVMVDPIDGSTNAKKGLPIFGSLISYFKSPSLDDLFVLFGIFPENVF